MRKWTSLVKNFGGENNELIIYGVIKMDLTKASPWSLPQPVARHQSKWLLWPKLPEFITFKKKTMLKLKVGLVLIELLSVLFWIKGSRTMASVGGIAGPEGEWLLQLRKDQKYPG